MLDKLFSCQIVVPISGEKKLLEEKRIYAVLVCFYGSMTDSQISIYYLANRGVKLVLVLLLEGGRVDRISFNIVVGVGRKGKMRHERKWCQREGEISDLLFKAQTVVDGEQCQDI